MVTKTTNQEVIKTDYYGIGEALSLNKLHVPLYQRSYAWEESRKGDSHDLISKRVV
jgi:hypothetical protein